MPLILTKIKTLKHNNPIKLFNTYLENVLDIPNKPSFLLSKQTIFLSWVLSSFDERKFLSVFSLPTPHPMAIVMCILLPPSSIFQQTFNTHTKLKPLTHYQINCSYLKLCNKKLNKITSTHCLKKFLKPSKCVPE